MTAPEVTPAVRRAAEALEDVRAVVAMLRDPRASFISRDTALDMITDALDGPEVVAAKDAAEDALLGPDVVWQGDGVRAVASNLMAVDDEGESDV